MNRKLHNTLFALTASGALLVMGLVVAAPLLPGQPSGPALAGTPMAQEINAAQVLATAIEAAAAERLESEPTSTRSTGTTRNRRQTLVMPYFSFVPRG